MSYRLRPFQSPSGFGMYGLRGLGECSATDPSGCAGPYSSPMANYDYQLNQMQSGGAQEVVAYTPPSPYTPEVCAAWDSPCVQRNIDKSINYYRAIGDAQNASNLQRCLDNNYGAAVCASRYPGVVASGNVLPSGAIVQSTPVTLPLPAPPVPVEVLPPIKYRHVDPVTGAITYTTDPTGAQGTDTPPAPVQPVVTTPTLTPGAVQMPPGTSAIHLPVVGGFDLSKIPIWGWAAAAVGAFFLFGGKR